VAALDRRISPARVFGVLRATWIGPEHCAFWGDADAIGAAVARQLEHRAIGVSDLAAKIFEVELLVIARVLAGWAAAGFKDTLLRCEMKPEVVHGNEKAIQPRVQA
jgi:hypothetical protein